MSESLSDLEQDIEASRARLDQTIDQIQGRLNPVNLADEMLGSARGTPLNSLYDEALRVVRENPVPVLMIVAGVGLLMSRFATRARLPELKAKAADSAEAAVSGAVPLSDETTSAGR